MQGRFVVDGHQDIAMTLLEDEGRRFGDVAPPGRALSLPDAMRGQLAVILATLFAPDGYGSGLKASVMARRQMRLYDELLFAHEQELFRVESKGDLELCRAGGPIGLVHLLEGADPVADPDDAEEWAEKGVRFVGPAWNTPNRYCGGTADEGGLTEAGRDLLRAFREAGVAPDLSHLNPRAVDDVLALDDGLVVASHSNAAAVRPHRRNLSDVHARAVAERGGVIGVVLFGPFLAEEDATIEHVVAHIDHLVELGGPGCVGIGSDLDGGFTTDKAPAGIDTVADLLRIGDALEARGYSDEDVAAILGGNWMRVLREVLPA